MKKIAVSLIVCLLLGLFAGCAPVSDTPTLAATTLPVWQFTTMLCEGTDITVTRVISEPVSCLHDYTLQVSQMRSIEGARAVILSGAGLEDFMEDALEKAKATVDASKNIPLLPGEEDEFDPHIWLSPANAIVMASNISRQLCNLFPEWEGTFQGNLKNLTGQLCDLQQYGVDALSGLSTREIITFHDGFSYLAQEYDLTILAAVEEESGSEASAEEIRELIGLVQGHHLPAIFTEANGSTVAAGVISNETGVKVFELDMAISGDDYFEAMRHNFDTLKEALQ